ncbi:MAG: trigger factor [Tannerellaceae bacterium]|jgi:trigger factor|nr:trigger factor [Tannerellaceae bacterium]
MNISLKRNDDAISGVLEVEVVKADYAGQVEKGLRGYQQKAERPGFRKGNVPMGIIRKMYEKPVLADEVNKLVSESVAKYIQEHGADFLGEPLHNEEKLLSIDFETQEDFVFYFDVALAPEVTVDWNKDDKLPYYQIAVDDEMVEEQVDSFRDNFGVLDDTVETVEEKDLIKGLVTELGDDGSPKEGGIVMEDGILMPLYIKDEEEKNKFIGAAKGSAITFNPAKAYNGVVAEIASFLKVNRTEAESIVTDFTFEIREISHHRKAEMNQEFFDKVLGEGSATTEEEFRNKIKEQIREQFTPQSDTKFLLDARKYLLQKVGSVSFADDILKRGLKLSGEGKTAEMVEEEYPKVIENLTFQLIKRGITKKNDIPVLEEDVERIGRRFAQSYLAQSGMYSASAEVLDKYMKELLGNEQILRTIIDHAFDDRFITWLKNEADLDVKEVSYDDFKKLTDEEKQ